MNPLRPRPRRTTAAALLLALCVVGTGALPARAEGPVPTATGRTVISDGHIDMGPRLDHGRWIIGIRDDSGPSPVWRDPDDTVLQAVDAAAVTVPADKRFSFLGRAGNQVWLLPQVQQQGVLWPGWNSQDPSIVHTVDREVTWKLESVRGPGRFLLFVNESFGTPTILFDTARRLPQETGIDINSHVHGNWAFSAPGTYLLGIRMSARSLSGTAYDTRATLRLSVGPQDPRLAFATEKPATAPTTASTAPTAGASGSSDGGMWIADGCAAVLLSVGCAVLLVRRRRTTASAVPATDLEEPRV
ncbi:TIGR03773 family transporter-associated surface protein [Actinacidiphila alni]|uniref:TIGR03773 family transporter-associated surface protein n=1 Tax=Actinacidiphila alni TaxID=380248 RepID=UPI000B2AD2A9|nr:TIGR03773 family transporter-associated surface protein [Actinacidiphila alni]